MEQGFCSFALPSALSRTAGIAAPPPVFRRPFPFSVRMPASERRPPVLPVWPPAPRGHRSGSPPLSVLRSSSKTRALPAEVRLPSPQGQAPSAGPQSLLSSNLSSPTA